MDSYPNILRNLIELRRNSRLNKHQHFSAGERMRKGHIVTGVPVVITNVFLGSLFFANVTEQVPSWASWTGAILALGAAFCGALQTFFSYEKKFEGHRKIANKYLCIQRRCETLCSEYLDSSVNLKQLTAEFKEILAAYNKVNFEAEIYQTDKVDYKRALEYDKKKTDEEVNSNLDVSLKQTLERINEESKKYSSDRKMEECLEQCQEN
ncbi:MAG: DUF4231 domain-containing protein [Gammaproteobacteria bacterium]|nr:DUF4231 domain-containing protein [Gammaproteobacteria bacterium]MDH5651110.1 DUF4231 domain-containing protein [Gammaproteobacteria bacterium]